MIYDRKGQEFKIFSNRVFAPNSYIVTDFGNLIIHLIYRSNLHFYGEAQFTYKMPNNFDGDYLDGTVTIYGEPYLPNKFKKTYDQFLTNLVIKKAKLRMLCV